MRRITPSVALQVFIAVTLLTAPALAAKPLNILFFTADEIGRAHV